MSGTVLRTSYVFSFNPHSNSFIDEEAEAQNGLIIKVIKVVEVEP